MDENLVRRKTIEPTARKKIVKSSVLATSGPALSDRRGTTASASATSASVSMNTAATTREAARCLRASSSCALSTVCDTTLPLLYGQARLRGANDRARGLQKNSSTRSAKPANRRGSTESGGDNAVLLRSGR